MRIGRLGLAVGMMAVATGPLAAQVFPPWDTFQDTLSNSVCAVVNASNTELVVLRSSGQLVIVAGPDVLLADAFVNNEGFVFYENQPAGLLGFAADGDGFRTLWWLTLTGNVVGVDGFTGEPFESNAFPEDFVDVPCDACPLWDDPTVCDPAPAPIVNICGVGVPLAASASLMGLVTFGQFRRRQQGQ